MTVSTQKITPVLEDLRTTAKMLNIGKSSLYSIIKKGELSAVKVGNRTMIRAADIESYVENLPAFSIEPALKKRKTAAA